MRDLLIDTLAHISPPAALEGLSAEQAAQVVPGASHSIVEIVAHMQFWQTWFLKRCQGVPEPMVTSAALGWPSAGGADWERLRSSFVDGLEQLAALGADPATLAAPVAPAIEFPPLAHHTVREALVHVAMHNAHHLGQVITLRQLMGAWPPPAGSYTF
jgi:uncharacterized damage-inducible protein DinB